MILHGKILISYWGLGPGTYSAGNEIKTQNEIKSLKCPVSSYMSSYNSLKVIINTLK
jgi:hypothetical protein